MEAAENLCFETASHSDTGKETVYDQVKRQRIGSTSNLQP